VRVRLTPEEHAAWSAARAVTGRRELGAWVRVTVNELLSRPSGERLDRPEPVPQIVDAQTYLTLVTAANAPTCGCFTGSARPPPTTRY
jgi:hypothetical protein